MGKEKFKCIACGMEFDSNEELGKHMEFLHGGEDHSGHEHFICKECGAIFHKEDELTQHTIGMHKPHTGLTF
jgi:uncharacterized C2H2 Zn-finger protein